MKIKASTDLVAVGWSVADTSRVLGYKTSATMCLYGVRAIKGRERTPERVRRMAEMAKEGKTLVEIGLEYGLTRERIRQIFVKNGFSTTEGRTIAKGQRDVQRILRQRKARDAKTVSTFGVSYEELSRINEGLPPSDNRSRAHRWNRQKLSAAYRGIPWSLSFLEWCAIWDASGKWELCGRGKGRYCMSRHADAGAYEVGNVRICTNEENITEGYKTRTPAQRQSVNVGLGIIRERAAAALAMADEGKTNEEIANHLGLSRSYVRNILAIGRRKRRDAIPLETLACPA